MLKQAIGRTLDRIYPWLSDHVFLRAYAWETNLMASIDPEAAVGGNWEQIGAVYFQDFIKHGLRPQHTLLDFGCGSLRIGRHLIAYLDTGNYTGADMSREVLRAGRRVVEAEGLTFKQPRLIQTQGELDFSFVDGRFDYVIATSVFTHLRRHQIEECLSNVHKVMQPSSTFFFTFLEGDGRITRTAFRQPFYFYEEAASRYGLHVNREASPLEQQLVSTRRSSQKSSRSLSSPPSPSLAD